jgi:hypothetical protein
MRRFQCAPALLFGFSLLATAGPAMAQGAGKLAQAHGGMSYAEWFIRSQGLFGLLGMLSGAAVFVGAWLVVLLARRPAVIAAYLVFLLLPLLFGIIGGLKGTVSSFAVLALTDTAIKQSAIFAGLAETLVPILAAFVTILPSYLVVAVGLFVRTLLDGRRRKD